ncbi:unnamed protein product [Cladocopium goreaui]|uniref:CTD small phosphatase-like protein 2 (CTDSP-like 2) n=1 Tax=Cladocopium goreaui TaxID=2562237 RepID=A0A9P1GLE7_9DINO|nr:unnamed protein product [Cladocopium goreaui]
MLKRSTRRFVVLTLLALWGASHDRLSFTPLLVVLDLDETLLHASLLKDDSWKWLKNPRLWQPASIDFEAKGKGLVLGLEEEIPLFVSLRPGAKEFLSWLKKQKAMEAMEIAVYTAGTQQYASQRLEKFPAFYRDACVPFGLPLAKDLCKLRQDLSRVVLVDNSKKSFWLQPDNGLLVSDWDGTNFSDRELTRVKQDLLDLLDLEDVRPALRSKSADASPGSLGWVVRFNTGVEKRIRAANLVTSAPATAADGNKELEQYMLQSNWSAIYQLFYDRFGVEGLARIDRGFAVKAAVEMTLSIVSKCFALLRSDPHGRLHCTPLHIAALQSSTEAAEVIVRDSPKVVERTHRESPSALSPLHIAILCGSHAIVELLLDGKANPNVCTLHSVSPLHLAATTSKELCQLLLAYSAEPSLHDVMGSNTLHYAATFKQHEVLEVLLQNPQASRLALEGDQKRVTALHLTCALYSTTADMHGPMLLLASGAKPWQADVSGTAARDVVPFSVNCELTKFFESHGDNSKAAAQAWLEELLLNTASDGSEATEDVEEEEDSIAVEAVPSPSASRLDGAVTERGAEIHMLREEVERLKTSLEDREQRCEELEPLRMKLQHSQEKVEMLEQAAKNQQQIFQVQMDLMDQSRSQHQAQLQELKERHAADRQQWEDRSHAEIEVRLRESQQEASAKLQQAELQIAELQAELLQAERRLQAEQEASQEIQRQLNRTKSQERCRTMP